MTHLYLLPHEARLLAQTIADLKAKIAHEKLELGDSSGQSAETYHDNYPFEQATRQIQLYASRLAEYQAIDHHSIVIDPPREPRVVAIGTVAKLAEDTGTIRELIISGAVPASDARCVSYRSPLGQLLLQARMGETRAGQIGGLLQRYTIVAITTLTDQVVETLLQ